MPILGGFWGNPIDTTGINFLGTWDANANTPTIVSSTHSGDPGDFYIVGTAGTTNIDGEASWAVGDWIIWDGTKWRKLDNTDLVTSVNTQTGAVVLGAGDVGADPAGTAAAGDAAHLAAFNHSLIATAVQASVLEDQKDPTGFVNRTDSSISWSDAGPGYTFTIDKTGAGWTFYIAGVAYTKTAAESVQLNPASEGLHYIYYDDSGVLQETNAWSDALITDYALVAMVYWDATNSLGELMEERHGCNMSGTTHHYLHDQIGAVWESGLALGDISADQDGSNNAHAQFSVATGEIYDEDVPHTINAIASNVGLEIWYLDGANWRKTTNAGYSFITDGVTSRIAYNNAGAQTAVGDGKYVLVHVFATNFADGNPIAIQGQAQYDNILAARDGAETEIAALNLSGLPSPEMKAIGTVIFQTKDSYTNAVNARIRSTDGGDDYVDFRVNAAGRGAPATDHGSLGGLADNDHPQYVIQGLDTNDYSIRPTVDGATAGNARGESSVDLQTSRTAATMVASGANSVIVGGANNTNDVAYGQILGGLGATVLRYGERAQASGQFAAAGDVQNGEASLRRSTTHSDTTWYTLNPDGTAATNLITIPEDSVMVFDALISGITAGAAESFGFQIRGVIENDGGTTSMKGTPVIDILDRADDTDFEVQAIASDANDALLIQVRDSAGDSGLTVRWGCNVRWQATIYPAP